MSLAKNKILVLGRPDVNKLDLVSQITKTSHAAGSAQIEWTLETKYFTALTYFWIDEIEEPHQSSEVMRSWLDDPSNEDPLKDAELSADMKELQQQLSDLVDAVIFVFDPLDPGSFLDILPWAIFVQQHQPEILLCVCQHSSSPTDQAKDVVPETLKDKWFGWCVSNGWEWVDLTDQDPEAEYTVDRIREALMSNQWDGSQPKTTQPAADNEEPEERAQREWDEFDKVAGSIDISQLHGMPQDLGNIDDLPAKLQSLRQQVAQEKDPQRARQMAAQLAMMLTSFHE